MAEQSGNQASSVFRSMQDLADAILAARTFGMSDITVTTVFYPASDNDYGRHVPRRVEYHLDCAMLGDKAETERQLAHIADVRSVLEQQQAG